jgi:hypothetical protein
VRLFIIFSSFGMRLERRWRPIRYNIANMTVMLATTLVTELETNAGEVPGVDAMGAKQRGWNSKRVRMSFYP